MNKEGKLYALLATARIANVPSVVSNLGVGVLLGMTFRGMDSHWPWLLTIAAVLFYVGGNFLNDWMDRDWDRVHRPERALPSGLFSRGLYLMVAVACFVLGIALIAPYGGESLAVGVILSGLICLYTLIHKMTAYSVIPMGMCRACLPILGFSAVFPIQFVVVICPALALLMYIVALSMSARSESRVDTNGKMKWGARSLLVGSGLVATPISFQADWWILALALLPFIVWISLSLTKYRSPVPTHVSALLAGIPLVDWIVLFPMALLCIHFKILGFTDGVFLTAIFLPPVAFILGRLLQRVAPAT